METRQPTSSCGKPAVANLDRVRECFSPERILELECWTEYTRALADWCIRQANISTATGDREEAMNWYSLAARTFALCSDPLVSREIEESLSQIGATLPRYPWQRAELGAPKRFLHVLDQPRAYGGLTAMARRWIETDPGNHIHSVALLRSVAEVPELLARAVAQSGGRSHFAKPSAPMLQRAAWLRQLACTEADCVVLHTDVWNAIVPVAFGVNGGPPVLLVNHAAHIFWLGASVADVVLNCRGSAYETHWTVAHRGIPRCDTLPIPLPVPRRASQFDPNVKRDAKIAIGLAPDCLAVLTVGDSFKYRPMPGLNFLETSRSILERCPEAALIVVGTTENADWSALASDLNHRVKVVGRQFDLRTFHDAADLYIEGFPFGSTTAFLEAVNEGIAAVLAPADCPPPFGTDGIAVDDVLPRPASLEAYVSEVVGLIRNSVGRERRAALVADSVARHHVEAGWQQHLARVVANTPAEHRVHPLHKPEPLPKELSLYWASVTSTWADFIGRHNGDPLEYVFRFALHVGLKPRLDETVRQACLRAKPFRNKDGAPLALYYAVSVLSRVFPKRSTEYLFRAFLLPLRSNGRLRRELRSLHKRLAYWRATTASASRRARSL